MLEIHEGSSRPEHLGKVFASNQVPGVFHQDLQDLKCLRAQLQSYALIEQLPRLAWTSGTELVAATRSGHQTNLAK